jgi:threonine/homoserine/homoserine lactone efflux protein
MNLSLFFIAAIAVIVVPGSNSIYVVSQTIARGLWHGMYAAFAIGLGSLLYALIVALGLGTLIADRPDVLRGVQLMGAGYLLYLGIQTVRSVHIDGDAQQEITYPASGSHTFGEALIVCMLNPKVVVFLLAFLPQFVDDSVSSHGIALAILGTLFALLGTLWAVALAVGAGLLAGGLQHRMRSFRIVRGISGILLMALSLFTAYNALTGMV